MPFSVYQKKGVLSRAIFTGRQQNISAILSAILVILGAAEDPLFGSQYIDVKSFFLPEPSQNDKKKKPS
jgi:hypothetical protein